MAFIILGLYRNMGNVPSAAEAASKAAAHVQGQRALSKGGLTWNAHNRKITYNQREKVRMDAAAEHTAKLAAEAAEYKKAQEAAARPPPPAKKANTLRSFHTMNPGLKSTIAALMKKDQGTSKNFVLLEFRNGITSNTNLSDQLKKFNKLILNPNDDEVAAQREITFESRSIKDRVRIWTGVEKKQFPALALQNSVGRQGLFREFFRDNGTDPISLLMVASASDEYNFWKYNESRNIQMNDKGDFDTIVLLCIISPNNDRTYDLDRNALETRGQSLYNGLLNAASVNNRFRMLAYKTKAEDKDLDDGSVITPRRVVELAYRNAAAELAPRAAKVDDSEKASRDIAAAAVEVFLAAAVALSAAAAGGRNPQRATAAALDAIQKFSNLGGKLTTNLQIGGPLEGYMSSVLNILIELTGGRGAFDERNRIIQEMILKRFHVPYMTAIANRATPMLLPLLKNPAKVNEIQLLIVLRNLTSEGNINITKDELSDTINILLEKVKAQDNDRLEFVLGILYNMTFMPDGNEAVKNGVQSKAMEEIMNIANNSSHPQSKSLAERILKKIGLATGGSRRIKKRKIESTRRRHKKHGR